MNKSPLHFQIAVHNKPQENENSTSNTEWNIITQKRPNTDEKNQRNTLDIKFALGPPEPITTTEKPSTTAMTPTALQIRIYVGKSELEKISPKNVESIHDQYWLLTLCIILSFKRSSQYI